MSRRERARGRAAPAYERSARLGELLRQILSDELQRLDDDRLELAAVTAVDVSPDLAEAVVHYTPPDDGVGQAFAEHRGRLRKAVGDQARVRRVPALSFQPDSGVEAGTRIDEILRNLHHGEAGQEDS